MRPNPGRYGQETKALLRLAGPLIVNNLSIAGMQFADAVMAGRLGAEALAAVAVGGSVWFLGFTVALGTLMAISPIAARHHGAGDEELIGRYTRQGLYLAVAFAIPVIVIAQFWVAPMLETIGIDVAFRDTTIGYVKAITLGAPGIMYTSIFALVCNVFLNWVFMFGKLGAPAMGAVGCGLASGITMWIIAIVLLVYMMGSKVYEPLKIFSRLAPLLSRFV